MLVQASEFYPREFIFSLEMSIFRAILAVFFSCLPFFFPGSILPPYFFYFIAHKERKNKKANVKLILLLGNEQKLTGVGFNKAAFCVLLVSVKLLTNIFSTLFEDKLI